MIRLSLTVDVMPMPRPRVSRRGGAGFPTRYRLHLASLKEMLRERIPIGELQLERGLLLKVTVYKPCAPTQARFGDADNLAKTILEALPFDDRYVTDLFLQKRRGAAPALYLEVIQL